MRLLRRTRTGALAAAGAALALLGCAKGGARPAPPTGEAGGAGTPEAQVRWVGRVTLDATDPDAIRFGWQGSGLAATVRGTRIAAALSSEDGREIFFHLVVDGTPLPRFSIRSRTGEEVVLADHLAPGEHLVELYRDTESHQGVTRFQGFTDGVVGKAPPSTGRLLEIVGDSISAGYGVLGSERHGPAGDTGLCSWAASNSSWALTYGALAGRALGAEVSTIAMSGWGLFEGGDDPTRAMGKVYERAYGAYVPGTWTFPRAPQAVVVALGANDLGPREAPTFDRERFVRAGVALVAQIRAHAPDAWVIFVTGPGDEEMQSILGKAHQAIVDRVKDGGDLRVDRLELPVPQPDASGDYVTGCQWHAGAAQHRLLAGVLARRLRERLGW